MADNQWEDVTNQYVRPVAPAAAVPDVAAPVAAAAPDSQWEDVTHQYAGLAPAAPPPAVPSATEAAIRGAEQGATLGFSDRIAGLGSAAYDKLTGNTEGKSFLDDYAAKRDQEAAANAAAQAAHPYIYGAGNVAGGIATGVATGGLTAPLGVVGTGAAMGAASGVGYGHPQDLTSGAEEALKGAVVGGTVGKVFGSLADNVNPTALSEASDNAAVRSLNPNTPQYKGILANETKYANSANPIGTRASLAQTMKDNDIGGLTSSLQDKLDQFTDLRDASGKAIEGVMGKLDQAGVSTGTTPQDIATGIMAKYAMPLQGFKSSQAAYNKVANLAEDIHNNFSGDDFATLQKVKDFVKSQTNYDAANDSTTNAVMKQVGKMVKDQAETSVDQGAKALGDPDLLNQYLQNKRDYGNSSIASDILNASTAREAANQRLGLSQTIIGASKLAAGQPLQAAAEVGALKAASLYGRNAEAAVTGGIAKGMQWSADRLNDIVRTNPTLLGPWAGVLSQAASRGPTSLGATNFILQQTSPAYRAHINSLSEGNKQ